mgnify:CR=1 FL=1
MIKDWKLKLRYGKLTTSYKHYTVLVPVKIDKYIEDFDAQPGTAWITVNTWTKDRNEACNMITDIGQQSGFIITGKFEVYATEAMQPPQESPYAYNVNFSYYKE